MVGFTSFIYIKLLLFSLFPRFPHSFLESGYFCCLLINFANSLFPGQYRQNVRPDLETDRLTPSDSVPERCFEKFKV